MGEPIRKRVGVNEREGAAFWRSPTPRQRLTGQRHAKRRPRLVSFVAMLYSFRHSPMRTLVPLDRAVFSFLGLEISGDLGDYTMWRTRRGKVVCYPRTVPGEPASPAQQLHRQHFRESLARWQLLSKQEKHDYELASLRCSLPMTGHNLWIRWTFAGNLDEARTIERLSGITLTLPPELSP